MHNQTASVVSLAKTIRGGLDKKMEMTNIPTATLELIMTTFIDSVEGENSTARHVESAARSFVNGRISGLEGR